jgi:hypothetical protein
MGRVKVDTNKKDVRRDAEFPYTDAGIERLLEEIYRVHEEEMWQGDISATILRLDLERALASNCLTPRQRQCIALYFFGCLTQQETAQVLGISQQAVDARIQNAVEAIAAHMSGKEYRPATQIASVKPIDGAISRWLDDVARNVGAWWNVPADVWREIHERFGLDVGEYVAPESEYTWLRPRARAWDREFPRPEIYPRFDGFGAMKGRDGYKNRLIRAI